MKDIEGYEGLYAVTEDGRVWSYKSNRYLVPSKKGCYSRLSLRCNGNTRTFAIHRLVAQAFIPNPNNFPCVCHKVESNVLDNSVDNLWWGTSKDNSRDMSKKGRQWLQTHSFEEIEMTKLEKLKRVKEKIELRNQLLQLYQFDSLKPKDVREIIINLKNYQGLLTDVAAIFGVSKERIRQIRNRK